MRSIATALASCALAFLLSWPGRCARPETPPPAPPKPYKAVAVTPARPVADPSFEAFRKELADIVKRKDRAALGKAGRISGLFLGEPRTATRLTRRNRASRISRPRSGLTPEDGSGWGRAGSRCSGPHA